MVDADGETLRQQLERSRRLGFLGPGPVDEHIGQSRALAEVIRDLGHGGGTGALLDLGSGGGIPGLVLIDELRWSRVVLLDRSERRCDFLRSAVSGLGVGSAAADAGKREAVTVVCGAAERAARDPGLRERFDVVVSRGFGPPATTAECAVGFLRPGGHLLVTDPPGGREWDANGLAVVGMELVSSSSDRPAWSLMVRVGDLRPDLPRPEGRSRRRPLF